MTVEEMKQEAVNYLGRVFKAEVGAEAVVVQAAVEIVTTLEAHAQQERLVRDT